MLCLLIKCRRKEKQNENNILFSLPYIIRSISLFPIVILTSTMIGMLLMVFLTKYSSISKMKVIKGVFILVRYGGDKSTATSDGIKRHLHDNVLLKISCRDRKCHNMYKIAVVIVVTCSLPTISSKNRTNTRWYSHLVNNLKKKMSMIWKRHWKKL